MPDTPPLSIRELLKQQPSAEELKASVRVATPKAMAPVVAPPQRTGKPVARVLVIWSKGPHDYELEYHRFEDGSKKLADAPVHLKHALKTGDPNQDKPTMVALGYSLESYTML